MRYLFLAGLILLTTLLNGALGQIGVSSFSYNSIGTDSIGKTSAIGSSTLPRCRPRTLSCSQAFTYIFTGNGNWTIPTNWDDEVLPPASLPQGAVIIIDPVNGGECVLNITQTILNNASLVVKAGKKLKLLNHLIIQH